ncbi:MAG: AraC family transcriptional regulator [Gammaproteobacteria bacterium]|nr:AraC family transcriptional regulator [Gammaproteobacteria bacterium]
MEVLSDILRSMRVNGSVYFCDHLHSPWSMEFKDTTSASFHLVRRGECWVTSGDQTERLGPGDLIFIEQGRDHELASQLAGQDPPAGEMSTLLLCGYCNFADEADTLLLDDFPSLIIVRDEELLKRPWLKSTLDQLSTEYLSQQPGSELVVNKLTEVVLVELIRINFGRSENSRIIRALSDKRIAKALQQLHNDLRHPWTLEKIGAEVGMSRAAFAKQFKALVGQPMLKYLTRLRVQRAKELLRDTKLPLYEIAGRVGYESDLAFTKTFSKLAGTTPTRFRKQAG